MPKFWRKRVVLAKVESVYGTDAAPTGSANAVLARTAELAVEAQEIPRDLIRSTIGDLATPTATWLAKLSLEVELASSGTAGTAPAWGPLLRGCAMSETVTAGTKVEYKPVSDNHDSLTLYWYADGLLHKLTGARGTVRFRMAAGEIPTASFEFTGFYATPSDAALPTADYSAFKTPSIPSKAATPTFDLHAVSSVARYCEVDLGNQVTFRDLIGASDVLVTDRALRGQASIEAVPVATKNWFDVAKNGTLGALSVVHGTAAGAIIEFAASYVQILRPRYEEQDGVIYTSMDLRPTENAGDDDFALIAR